MENTQQEQSLSLWQRISGVLWEGPREAFGDISKKPHFFNGLIFIIVFHLLLAIILFSKTKEIVIFTLQQELAQNPDMEAIMDIAVTAGTIWIIIGAVLMPVIIFLIIALILKLYNVFTEKKVAFKQLFAIAVFAYFPILIAALISSSMIYFTPVENFMNVSTSLFLLFPPESTGFVANLARQIDPFFLWSIYLTALGAAVVMKSKLRNTAIYLYSIWGVYAVIMAIVSRNYIN